MSLGPTWALLDTNRRTRLHRFAGNSVKLFVVAIALAGAAQPAAAQPAVASGTTFLGRLNKIRTLASMVPAHGPAPGDQNPYGVAVVPRSSGALVRGDVLVSNFNNKKNQQGTGSSIIEVSPSGRARVFSVVPRPTPTPAVGLTTALVALRSGFVIVGSLPAPGGNSRAARAGALSILNDRGQVVRTIAGGDVNGPWDMTAFDGGTRAVLFVTNVLTGTVAAKGKIVHRGTVVRIALRIQSGRAPTVSSNQVIATGFAEHTDPNALVVGPTGVGLARNGTLYVADSSTGRVAAIPRALTRTAALGGGGATVARGGKLNDPLGLAIAPNGDVLTMNGGDGNAVETTPGGRTAAVKTLVADGGGDLFGLAITPSAAGVYFVNDAGSGPARQLAPAPALRCTAAGPVGHSSLPGAATRRFRPPSTARRQPESEDLRCAIEQQVGRAVRRDRLRHPRTPSRSSPGRDQSVIVAEESSTNHTT